jgi:integrase
MIKNFTDTVVRNLKPTDKDADYLEAGSNGFGIRVSPSGLKKFFYRYNKDDRRRFLPLGHYKASDTQSGITLAEARRLFVAAQNEVKAGRDPANEKKMAAVERKRTPFVTDFVQEYIENYAKANNKQWRNIERALHKDLVPRFGSMKITDIRRRDLVNMLEDVAKRAPVGANRLQAYISKMLSYAVKKEVVPTNVLLGVEKAGGAETPRERYLDESEIKLLWGALDTLRISDTYKGVLKLTLLTGQRPGEVCNIHRSQLDGDWWTIPADVAKNKRVHRVYLVPMAKDLLTTDANELMEYPFYQGKDWSKPLREDTLANVLGDIMELLPVAKFTAHDLRRTMTTHTVALGVPEAILDIVQNHVSARGPMARKYNQYKYDKEKKATLQKWEKKLKQILGKKAKAVKWVSILDEPPHDPLNTDPVVI